MRGNAGEKISCFYFLNLIFISSSGESCKNGENLEDACYFKEEKN
jgi:hypothetical protein